VGGRWDAEGFRPGALQRGRDLGLRYLVECLRQTIGELWIPNPLCHLNTRGEVGAHVTQPVVGVALIQNAEIEVILELVSERQ
jgi:hypothetical protein